MEDIESKRINLGHPGIYRLLTSEEPKGLVDHKDLIIDNATMQGLVNFVEVRKDAILYRKAQTHLMVESRKSEITLTVGEHGGLKMPGDVNYRPRVVITAKAELSADFKEVMEYLGNTHPSAHDLAMEFRQKEYLFENRQEWARVVGKLRDTNLKINTIKKETSSDAGERENRMRTEITEGQLDLRWNFRVPIYEGQEPVLIEALAIWEVQDNYDVHVVILNGGVETQRRMSLKDMTQNTLDAIKTHLGNEVPVVFVDNK